MIAAPASAAMTLVASVAMSRSGASPSGHAADEGFSRRAGKKREARLMQLGKPREDRKILLRRFAEPEARVEHDPIIAHACAARDENASLEIAEARFDRIAVDRNRRPEQAGIVHGDHARAVVAPQASRCPDRPAARGCR